jgi:hypothetical protein
LLQRENGQAATAAVIANSFRVCRRFDLSGVLFRVKRGLAKQISFISGYGSSITLLEKSRPQKNPA